MTADNSKPAGAQPIQPKPGRDDAAKAPANAADKPRPNSQKARRQARLEEELRANLKRRKDQARLRNSTSEPPVPQESAKPDGPDRSS